MLLFETRFARYNLRSQIALPSVNSEYFEINPLRFMAKKA